MINIHGFCFPLEMIFKWYNKRKPWLSPILRDAIKRKANCILKVSNKDICVMRRFINTIVIVQKDIKAAEKKFYNDIISTYIMILEGLSIMKTVMNKNKKIQNQKELKLGYGSLTSDMKLICHKFSDFFFINVGSSLSKQFQHIILCRLNTTKTMLLIVCILNMWIKVRSKSWLVHWN